MSTARAPLCLCRPVHTQLLGFCLKSPRNSEPFRAPIAAVPPLPFPIPSPPSHPFTPISLLRPHLTPSPPFLYTPASSTPHRSENFFTNIFQRPAKQVPQVAPRAPRGRGGKVGAARVAAAEPPVIPLPAEAANALDVAVDSLGNRVRLPRAFSASAPRHPLARDEKAQAHCTALSSM